MKKFKNKRIVYSISLILMLILIPEVSLAEEITFAEALNRGLQAAGELRHIRENINNLERTLSTMAARQDWQVELGADYNHIFSGEENQISSNLSGSNFNQNRLNLGISKSFSSGLAIKPQVTLKEEGETDFSINANYPLYPLTPTEISQQIYKTKKELARTEFNLLHKKSDLMLSWLEKYLDLSRVREKEKIYQKSLIKAEENLQEALKRRELGEAGQQELLTARLGVKEAEYRLEELQRQIEEAKTNFFQSLGLAEETGLKTAFSSVWYQNLTARVKELTNQYLAKNDLMTIVAANNYELYVNRINQEILEQELTWLREEDNTSINLSGSYNSTRDEFTAGISLSHQLYDGGQQELKYEGKEAEIAAVKADYSDIYQNIKSQLRQHRNRLELNEMRLEKEKLALEKSTFEAEIFQEQLERGLLDYLEYQEKWLNNRETEINFKSLQDQILLDRLKFITFTNIHELTGGLF